VNEKLGSNGNSDSRKVSENETSTRDGNPTVDEEEDPGGEMRQSIVQHIKAISARFPRQCPLIWSIRKHGGRIAITFDDGPTGITPQVLECLERYKVRATFFVLVGQVSKRPELIGKILTDGHEIGIHGYEHSMRDYYAQIQRSKEELAEFGVTASLVRTPGCVIKPLLTMRLWWRGYQSVAYSFDAHDSMRLEGKWDGPAPDYNSIRGGDIILMHDDNSLGVQELPLLLEKAHEKNLSAVTVSELIGNRPQCPPNNI
jgi:peptidoglycan/xylan/chitin deacetylase (PgdA/CDA1 family)